MKENERVSSIKTKRHTTINSIRQSIIFIFLGERTVNNVFFKGSHQVRGAINRLVVLE